VDAPSQPIAIGFLTRYPTSGMDTKRALDLVVGTTGLVAGIPILVALAAYMRISGDRGPFLYRALRMGEGGDLFTVLKVRTMEHGAVGAEITMAGDAWITPLGRRIRRYRLDERPQLVNVVRGEMSMVGPRPESPAFVDLGDPDHRRVFLAKPGITGLAQLKFHDEAALLSGPDPERRYREEVLPAKLRLDIEYLDWRTTWLDIKILVRTVGAVFGH
jgi:lipopolysaccharide/colanic/teichoic acid biosynthesis glycosyltransferase